MNVCHSGTGFSQCRVAKRSIIIVYTVEQQTQCNNSISKNRCIYEPFVSIIDALKDEPLLLLVAVDDPPAQGQPNTKVFCFVLFLFVPFTIFDLLTPAPSLVVPQARAHIYIYTKYIHIYIHTYIEALLPRPHYGTRLAKNIIATSDTALYFTLVRTRVGLLPYTLDENFCSTLDTRHKNTNAAVMSTKIFRRRFN